MLRKAMKGGSVRISVMKVYGSTLLSLCGVQYSSR